MKSIAGASKELELLVQLMPADAHMVMPTMVHDVKTDTLKENDHHENAVKMFNAEISHGMNPDLKRIARQGIIDQTKEISHWHWIDQSCIPSRIEY